MEFWNKEFDNVPKGRKMYFHIHVPKTGGTTFWEILRANFDDLSADYSKGGHPEKYTRRVIEEIIYQWKSKCFTAHHYCLNNLPQDNFPNLRAMSFVREPVQKVISSYFFLRGRRLAPKWHFTKRLTLMDCLNSNVDILSNQILFDSSQVDFISGVQNKGLELIRTRIKENKFHLFPMERFDDAMICLEKLYPEDFTDCSYGKRSNVSNKDQQVTEKDLEMIKQLPWIEKDRKLHQLSFTYIDQLMNELFLDADDLERARDDFKRRCHLRLEIKKVTKKKTAIPFVQRIKRAAKIILKGY